MLQGGPSDEDALRKLVETYTTAFQAGDVDTLIPLYSKNYETERGDYEQTVERMREWVPRMAEWDVEISADNAEIAIEGNTARVGPVTFESDRGSRDTTLLTTKEEDGCWRITGAERERREE
jgi:ketosteroid isomerase-like protein